MASAKIFRINYLSDFILTLTSDAGWMTPFCIKFWTGVPSQAYYVGWDGETYDHCSFDPSEPTKLQVQFDDHHLPIGDLKYQVAYHFNVADFPNDTEDEVINAANITTEIDGETYQVMLDFTGETAPEIQFALPAYANEAQRIANEQQRIANEEQRIANEETRIQHEQQRIAAEQIRQQNEQQRINQEQARVNEYATLKADAVAATGAANDAAALANQKAQLAADKAALAQAAADLANAKAQLAADKAALAASAAQLANDKAALAQQKAEYAQTQGDYAKTQGDYAKEQGDTALADHQRAEADHGIAVDDHTQAGNDHTRAESDHGIAVGDHTQAGNDHTRAESDHDIAVDDHTQAGTDHQTAAADHQTAAADHTQAGNDHTRAESDHTRAESDHAAVEVYVDSLGAFDISAYHATGGVLAKYADLTAAIGTGGANIPDALRKGGMSVKYVSSSDNNYVQYFLTKDSWSASEGDWEKMNLEEEVSQLCKEVGYKELFEFESSGEKQYHFVDGLTYLVKNTSPNNVSVSIRETQSGENHDTTVVNAGQTASITASQEGYWIRVGTACSLEIQLSNNINVRLTDVEQEITKIEPLESQANKNGSESQFGLKITFLSAGTIPFDFNDGDAFLVSNYSDTPITISTRETVSGIGSNILQIESGKAGLWNVVGNYNYLRCGSSAQIIIHRIKGILFNNIEIPDNKYRIVTPDVGETLDTTPVATDTMLSYILPVNADDVVHIKGKGASASRVYAITDADYKVVQRADSNATIDDLFVIRENGFVVVNYYKDQSYALAINNSYPQELSLVNLSKQNNNGIIFIPASNRRLINLKTDSVIIPKGSRIIIERTKSVLLSEDVELTYPSGFLSYVVLIDNITLELSIQGSNATIGNTKTVLFSISTDNTNVWCTLPVGYYAIFNDKYAANTDGIAGLSLLPDRNIEMFDFSTDILGVQFNTTMMEQVYALFDSLVQEAPDYISKVDAAVEAELTYPSYANGISAGDANYLQTPAYKTYLYKLIDRNQYVHTNKINKGKIFIVSGTHGNEIASIFNSYLIAKQLVKKTENEFYNALRSNYDVYILPCLNGYGIYHNTRVNANGVNINRNAPLPWWSESGIGTSDYTGAYAGSEFETQLFVKLCELYNFDMVIDHHNYAFDNTQFYAVGVDESMCAPAYLTLVNCCLAWRKNLPSFFGTNYKLFINAGNNSLPGYIKTNSLTLSAWAHYYKTPCALTLEVSSCVCYSNGIYIGEEAADTMYSSNVFSIAEQTVRESISNYLNAFMKKLLK